MKKISSIIGLIAGGSSIVLWFVLNFLNPYSNELQAGLVIISFTMLFLPASLAIISSLLSKNSLMAIAFLWSLPLSLYLAMMPGIFSLFGVTSISYLVSFIYMRMMKKVYLNGNSKSESS